MSDRLTDAQLRNQREQALRAFRRLERKVDTRLEVIERKLDRSIENKEKITIRLVDGMVEDFKKFWNLVKDMENGLADTIQIFLS